MQTTKHFRNRVINTFNKLLEPLVDEKNNTDVYQINDNIKKLKILNNLFFRPNAVMNDKIILDEILKLIILKQKMRSEDELQWSGIVAYPIDMDYTI